MAINKRKVLDGARKYAQKGAKQKALKEYNKLIQADPRDAKLLLEVGDAYRRWGQAEEAIAQYTKVANQYKSDGFDARAVAVLKQILNLDPKRYTAHVALAELYQRMGLDSDAVGALQTAADGYYRDGRRKEALELLRKMAALDPSNTTSRIKVADLLRQEGMEDEAVSEYEEVAAELVRQGANEQATVVQERILEIRPDRIEVLVALARALSDLGRPERAEGFAKRAVEKSGDPDHYELLCGIYKSLGNDDRLAEVTRNLAALYRERGDDERAREVMQRIPSESLFETGGLGADRSEASEVATLDDDELLEDEDFLVTDEDQGDELSLDMPAEDVGGDLSESSQAEDALPDGDPNQLFAEATVYMRYGKRDQAMASLKAVLLQEPDHRGALEKLGEAHAEGGDAEAAVGCWLKAAEAARAAGDEDAYGILRDRIGALDPQAAAELEPVGEAADTSEAIALEFDASEDEAEDYSEDDSDELFEVDDEEFSEEEPAAEAGQDESVDFELDISLDEDVEASETDASDVGDDTSVEIEMDDSEFEIDVDDDSELDVSEQEEEADEPLAAMDESGGGESTTTAAKVQEDLEEAEFYLQQGMNDEAEGIYRRILSVAPNHPVAMLKLGELAAERGEDPGTAPDVAAAADVPAEDDSAAGFDLGLDDDAEQAAASDDDEEPELSDDLAAIMAEAEAAVDARGSGGAEAEAAIEEAFEIDLDADGDDAAGATEGPLDAALSEDATEVEHVGAESAEPTFAREPVQAEPDAAAHETTDDTLPLSDDDETGGAGLGAVAAAADGGGDTFDLAAELADVFEGGEGDTETDPGAISGRSTVEEGFESIFADFKKGVSATLDAGDYDTRFDLGIAYREMGLFDDAIAEFQVCLASDARRCECLHMMALCAMELGRLPDAMSHLEQALATGDLAGDRRAGIQFDLGRVHAMAGDTGRARSAFQTVRELDAGFPGVDEQIEALDSGAPAPAPAQSDDDGWESFDDIMGGGDDSEPAVDAAPAGETFESFDDVLEEVVEAVPEEAQATGTPGTEPEPAAAEPAPEPEDTNAKTQRGGRKKKISFV